MTNNTTVEAANSSLDALLDRVSQGEEITITRNGQPAAKIIATNPVLVKTAFNALSLVPTEIDNAKFQELCKAYDAAV